MKRSVLTFSILVLLLSYGPTSSSATGSLTVPQTPTVTLYARNKYQTDPRARCFNLEAGSVVTEDRRCDLLYGTLYAGDDFDWFQSWAGAENRSVIRDLGPQLWTDALTVPVIEPLPKLKPGEQRRITIDTSGADGADGAPGAPAVNAPGARVPTAAPKAPVVQQPARPKNDGIPKIDSLFAKAIVGHMYAIHVVDPASDFYALFRVEALERGDKCTISWRLIPSPADRIEKATRY